MLQINTVALIRQCSERRGYNCANNFILLRMPSKSGCICVSRGTKDFFADEYCVVSHLKHSKKGDPNAKNSQSKPITAMKARSSA
jgi:hypothetical protein